jgi:hypothetical protein
MPIPPGVAIAATVFNALLFALMALISLFAFAIVVGGVHLSVITWIDLTLRLLVQSSTPPVVSFCVLL